jgi:hypothetical protein
VLFLRAQTLPAFMMALALQGVFRALDSGPLEAWYVDTAQADNPDVPVERALSGATTVLGLAIALGALASGGLVAWHPVQGISPLLLPFWIALGLNLLHLVLTAVLVRETPQSERGCRARQVWSSFRRTPAVVRSGIQLLGSAPVLRSLVLVEVFWSVAMIAFETLHPGSASLNWSVARSGPAQSSGRSRRPPGGFLRWAPTWLAGSAGGSGWRVRRCWREC